mgnify:CR=1 FL=1
MSTKKKILYIDMDGVLVNFQTGINKLSEEEKIKYFKRSVVITRIQLDECRELLTLMGVPYIDAPEEADSQCAWLAKKGLVDAVLTEDMDINCGEILDGTVSVQEMGQRILTLATQAANGTLGVTERTAIVSEMRQLLTAINTISTRTKFATVSEFLRPYGFAFA